MQPRQIIWGDGRTYPIEQVRDFRPANTIDNLPGDCYTVFYPTVQFSTFGACAVQSVLSPGHNKSGFDCSKPLYNCGSGNSLGELSFPANRNQIL